MSHHNYRAGPRGPPSRTCSNSSLVPSGFLAPSHNLPKLVPGYDKWGSPSTSRTYTSHLMDKTWYLVLSPPPPPRVQDPTKNESEQIYSFSLGLRAHRSQYNLSLKAKKRR